MIILKEFKEECLLDNIPIIQDDALEYIINIINKNNFKYMLEIGTAYGYSSITTAINTTCNILSVEKDSYRFNKAITNIEKNNLQKQINVLLYDASKLEIDGDFDIIFLDGPKAQYEKHFLKFSNNLKIGGYLIVDNMFFHNLDINLVKRQTRQLIKKINKFKEFVQTQENYECNILSLGDGLCVCKKIKE